MLKLSLVLATTFALAAPNFGWAADAEPQPDLEAFQKAVAADGLTCPLGPLTLRENSADRWIIEFRCASADDGRLGVFPKKAGEAQTVYNCARAKIVGFSCVNTKENVAFPTLTADIKKFDFSSQCKVSQTRLMGLSANKKTSYLEVKCDDSNLSGQVLQYDVATQKPTALASCDDATSLAGGCRIPGAVKNQKGVNGQGMSGVAGVTRGLP